MRCEREDEYQEARPVTGRIVNTEQVSILRRQKLPSDAIFVLERRDVKPMDLSWLVSAVDRSQGMMLRCVLCPRVCPKTCTR